MRKKIEIKPNFSEFSSNDLVKNTTFWAIRTVSDFMDNYIYKTIIRFKRMFESQNKNNHQAKTNDELIINFAKSKTEKYMDIIKTISTKTILDPFYVSEVYKIIELIILKIAQEFNDSSFFISALDDYQQAFIKEQIKLNISNLTKYIETQTLKLKEESEIYSEKEIQEKIASKYELIHNEIIDCIQNIGLLIQDKAMKNISILKFLIDFFLKAFPESLEFLTKIYFILSSKYVVCLGSQDLNYVKKFQTTSCPEILPLVFYKIINLFNQKGISTVKEVIESQIFLSLISILGSTYCDEIKLKFFENDFKKLQVNFNECNTLLLTNYAINKSHKCLANIHSYLKGLVFATSTDITDLSDFLNQALNALRSVVKETDFLKLARKKVENKQIIFKAKKGLRIEIETERLYARQRQLYIQTDSNLEGIIVLIGTIILKGIYEEIRSYRLSSSGYFILRVEILVLFNIIINYSFPEEEILSNNTGI